MEILILWLQMDGIGRSSTRFSSMTGIAAGALVGCEDNNGCSDNAVGVFGGIFS